ncbi:MAG: hypothetical protein COA73_12490 [Candidatus Hydrogenedentota bacterium]|nr:MAG: hypothetical protein COA73_12490 [Candidatus Hydrogenedentota bacterium]
MMFATTKRLTRTIEESGATSKDMELANHLQTGRIKDGFWSFRVTEMTWGFLDPFLFIVLLPIAPFYFGLRPFRKNALLIEEIERVMTSKSPEK